MPVSTENIRRWIEQSDIDYITHFIKAWIPFNAWYNSHFSTLNSDREKISAIKNHPNPVRNGINSYLENDGQINESFRNALAALYFSLQQHELENRDGKISFHEIVKEKNVKNLVDNEVIRTIKYYLKRTDGRNLGEVNEMVVFMKDRNNKTFFSYTHSDYELSHFLAHPNFVSLSTQQKENVKLFFDELKPIIVTDVIEASLQEQPKNYYSCDSYNFKRDPTNAYCPSIYTAKALVEVLYQLRNILFHGELIPNEGTQPIYRSAYMILKLMLDKIR